MPLNPVKYGRGLKVAPSIIYMQSISQSEQKWPYNPPRQLELSGRSTGMARGHCCLPLPSSLSWYGASLGGSKSLNTLHFKTFLMSQSCIKDPDSTQTKAFYITYIITINYYISQKYSRTFTISLFLIWYVIYLCHPTPSRHLPCQKTPKSEKNCGVSMSDYLHWPQITSAPYSKW